ncbi:hypothetical protein DPEC_G00062300 [Dallia pectoralis]|uniref:Uncharacterized protein n=1 Tax=Dallia pectoralis TaxID=75939 RepID=A0ACC2H7X9_DALPE|nr:hypothetical protein DPEC_G00062300 [Dallia pectoralis]
MDSERRRSIETRLVPGACARWEASRGHLEGKDDEWYQDGEWKISTNPAYDLSEQATSQSWLRKEQLEDNPIPDQQWSSLQQITGRRRGSAGGPTYLPSWNLPIPTRWLDTWLLETPQRGSANFYK